MQDEHRKHLARQSDQFDSEKKVFQERVANLEEEKRNLQLQVVLLTAKQESKPSPKPMRLSRSRWMRLHSKDHSPAKFYT